MVAPRVAMPSLRSESITADQAAAAATRPKVEITLAKTKRAARSGAHSIWAAPLIMTEARTTTIATAKMRRAQPNQRLFRKVVSPKLSSLSRVRYGRMAAA